MYCQAALITIGARHIQIYGIFCLDSFTPRKNSGEHLAFEYLNLCRGKLSEKIGEYYINIDVTIELFNNYNKKEEGGGGRERR